MVSGTIVQNPRRKLGIHHVTLPIPKKEDPNYKAWHRCNIMVVNWITRSLSPQLAQSTIYLDNAKKLWDELKERFPKGDYFRISDLIQEIHSIKQGDKSVTEFFTEFKILWDELEMLSPTLNVLVLLSVLVI